MYNLTYRKLEHWQHAAWLLLGSLMVGLLLAPQQDTPTAIAAGAGPALIISEVVDATLPDGLPKFVELTNVGTTPIDLSQFSIGNFNNGGTTLGGGAATVLAGTLAAGDSYVISYENGDSPGVGTFFDTYGFDPDNFDLGAFFNGDDVIALFQGAATGDGSDATLIDVYGVIGVDGTGEPWEYTDGYAFRNSSVTMPNATFTASEWTIGGANSLETGDDATELPLILNHTTPGTMTTIVPEDQLLLTELVAQPTNGEFIEIYNPGSSAVDLSNIYLTDATFAGGSTFYYNIVTGSNAGGGGFGDFHARFPDGASIGPDEYQSVALNGSADFLAVYGVAPTYELYDDGTANGEQAMREALAGAINGQGGLSNDGEVVVLYFWDGQSDLVTDLDYALWGDKAEAVDKSGVAIDGPDVDSDTTTYLNDTAIATQAIMGIEHAVGSAWQRDDLTEGAETKTGGNGANGHDETSEDLNNTWCESTTPTPNAASQCPTSSGVVLKIYEIQGNGAASPFDGQVIETGGIVVADFQGNDELNGFFLQDPTGDGDMSTSDGIFVLDPGGTAVNAGDVISITAEIDEENELTTLKNVLDITIQSSGNALPTPAQVTLPENTDGELEQYEGMYVQITDSSNMLVAQNFFLGRYGQISLAAGERLYQPTNQEMPGSPAANALAEENAKRFLILDDGQDVSACGDNPNPVPYLGSPPPTVIRAGDQVSNLIGTLDFGQINSGNDGSCANPNTTFNRDYRLHPTTVPTFTPQNLRQNSPDDVGGTLKVATLNVLNYFTTLDTGPDICGPAGDLGCRGADSASELTRQRDKIVAALQAIDADIVGLVELENNAAANPANDGADPVLEDLVNALNAAVGAGTYGFIDAGVIGTDAIKVAFIYKPATTTPAGTPAILDSSVDPTFIDTKNRPALAQTFQENSTGERFTAVVNHLKSKGSPCDDVGDPTDPNGQGNCNGTRTDAAVALANWLATDPTGSGDPDFMIIGDLNAYAMEDPITALKNAGYTDLINQFLGDFAYSYTFDALLGYLDHALANASLTAQVTGATEWHINTDEPAVISYDENFNPPGYYSPDAFRASDHDPVIVGLHLGTDQSTPPTLYISTEKNGRIGDIRFRDEDILRFDGETESWSLYFDGSDVGVARADLDAFHILEDGSILMSFDQAMRMTVGTMRTVVDDSDIVRFIPTQLGTTTIGTFELVFVGRDVELARISEDIDALGMDENGNLVFSVIGTLRAQDLVLRDEDLVTVSDTNLLNLLFDGSDVALDAGREDVTGLAIDGNTLYLSTKGPFRAEGSASNVDGNSQDIFICELLSSGEVTDCLFSFFFDASFYGLRDGIDGLSFGNTRSTGNGLATASNSLGREVDASVAQFEVIEDVADGELDEELDEYDLPVDGESGNQEIFLPLITNE